MTREQAKQKFDNFGKSFTLEETRLDTHILIDQIYDAHEVELKAKDERIAELEAQIKAVKEYCREQVDNINKIGDLDIIDVMKRTIYRDILNKAIVTGKQIGRAHV